MKILINDLFQFSNLPDSLKSPSLQDSFLNQGLLNVLFAIPDLYSEFSIYDGVLSQPYFDPFDGVLSQPMFRSPVHDVLIDDVGNILIDDQSNEYYNNNFATEDNPILDGILSQPFSSVGALSFDCLGIGGTDASQIIINGDVIINSGNERAFEDGLYEIGQTVTASNITIEHNGSYMGRLACGTCYNIPVSPSREPGLYSSVKTRISLSGQVVPTAGGYGGDSIGVDIRYKFTKELIEEFRRAYVTQTMKGFPFFLDFDNTEWFIVQKFYGRTANKLVFQSSINRTLFSKRFDFLQAF